MAQSLELTLLLADYHRTRPLLDGEVTARGIKLQPRRAETGEACMRPVYEEFDIAEMSLSWYMMARCRKEPVIALPIFPLRMQIHPYIFCSSSSQIETPQDLKGKKIGMDQYRLTVGLWARGILQEYYGVRPQQCEWITSEPEGAGYRPPPDIKITVAGQSTEGMLLRGEIDALIPPNVVPYLVHPWVVANDRLRAAGWRPQHTNEEAIIEGLDSLPSARYGRALLIGGAASVAMGIAAGTAWRVLRRMRATRRPV